MPRLYRSKGVLEHSEEHLNSRGTAWEQLHLDLAVKKSKAILSGFPINNYKAYIGLVNYSEVLNVEYEDEQYQQDLKKYQEQVKIYFKKKGWSEADIEEDGGDELDYRLAMAKDKALNKLMSRIRLLHPEKQITEII